MLLACWTCLSLGVGGVNVTRAWRRVLQAKMEKKMEKAERKKDKQVRKEEKKREKVERKEEKKRDKPTSWGLSLFRKTKQPKDPEKSAAPDAEA